MLLDTPHSAFSCVYWPTTEAISSKALDLSGVLLTDLWTGLSIHRWSAAESLCGVLRFSAWRMDSKLCFGYWECRWKSGVGLRLSKMFRAFHAKVLYYWAMLISRCRRPEMNCCYQSILAIMTYLSHFMGGRCWYLFRKMLYT